MTPGCEIVTIGSELLLGQIVDTNATWLADTLSRSGIRVLYHTTVGDDLQRIVEVFRLASSRVDLVLSTGGLGPTRDDLTRRAAAETAGVPLVFRPDLMEQIEAFFRKMGYRMPENNRVQAYIPQGSEAVVNPVGTAPGFRMEWNGTLFIALPGVPKELKYLVRTAVLPLLRQRFSLGARTIHYKVLRLTGLGESAVDRQIGDLIREHSNPSVGLLASPGDIRIRIAAEAESEDAAEALIRPMEEEIRRRLGVLIYGTGEDTLEGALGRLLRERGYTVAVADSVGSGAAERLVRACGSVVRQAWILPSVDAVRRFLGDAVRGAPGGEDSARADALAVAEEAARRSGADVGLALLGFPEPADKGLRIDLAVGIWGKGLERTAFHSFEGDRDGLFLRCTIIALDRLRKTVWEQGAEE